jgi:hypothetical protein
MPRHWMGTKQALSQAKAESNAVCGWRALPGSRGGTLLLMALLLAVLLSACGQAGADAGPQPAATRCVSGQANALKSGGLTWDGQFAQDWAINQPQQVTILPDGGFAGGMFQLDAQPVSLRLGQQNIDAPPAFSLHVTGTLPKAAQYPVTLSLPVAGCWKLTAQFAGQTGSIYLRADAPAGASACPVSQPSPAVTPGDVFAYGSDPIFWDLTPPYSAKTPITLTLRVTRGNQPSSLPLTAAQLAEHGQTISFSAAHTQISSDDSGAFYQNTPPLALPAGCWLLTAYNGGSNGYVVVQVQ